MTVVVAISAPPVGWGAQEWIGPLNLSDSTPPVGDAYDADVAMDGDGNATAAWIRNNGSIDRVQTAVRAAGQVQFGAPATISPAGDGAYELDLAVNAAGDAVASWLRFSDTAVLAAFRPAGGSFGAPQVLSTDSAFASRAAIDPDGTAHVVWARQVGSKSRVEASTRPLAGAFATPELISSTNAYMDDPALAAGSGGTAIATWTRYDNGSSSIVESASRIELSYPRPGGGTPLRVPLVVDYAGCTSPNATHAAPLDYPSCSPPQPSSSLLTTGNGGQGQASLLLKAIAGDPVTPADEADVTIAAAVGDVRCATGGSPGCAAAGADYTGQLAARLSPRITDLSNGIFEDDPGTVATTNFSFPIGCTANGTANLGSTCNLTTTFDSLVPGYVRERKRTVMQALSITVDDAGADGSFTPGSGACPPTCGSGDERTFLRSGVFLP